MISENKFPQKLIAVFLIQLLVGFPLASFTVIAAEDGSITGVDVVQSIEGGVITLQFIVKVSGDANVLGSDVSIGGKQAQEPCRDASAGKECIVTFTPSEGGEYTYSVELYNGKVKFPASGLSFVILDVVPPKIQARGPEGKVNSNVELAYTVTDTVCKEQSRPQCVNKCLGLKKIEYWSDAKDSPINDEHKQTLDITTPDCTFDGTQNKIAISNEQLIDGKQTITLVAYDATDIPSAPAFVIIEADFQKPQIARESFKLFASDGTELAGYSPTQQANVNAEVIIPSEDVALDTVSGDFSKLTGTETDTHVPPTACTKSEDGFDCRWENLLLHPVADAVSIVLRATDAAGNAAEDVTIEKTLAKDESFELVSLATPYSNDEADGDEKIFYGTSRDNNVTAIFNEESGVAASDVLLSLDSTQIPAQECEKSSGTQWKCAWSGLSLYNGIRIGISSDSKDILGNLVKDSAGQISITVSDQKPVAEEKDVVITGFSAGTVIQNIVKTGDTLGMTAQVSGELPVSAVADVSKVSSVKTPLKAVCILKESLWECVWPHDASPAAVVTKSGTIQFTFQSASGVQTKLFKQITPLGVGGAQDLWEISEYSCAPKNIDRKLLSIYDSMVSKCSATLRPLKPDAQILSVVLKDNTCVSDTEIRPIKSVTLSSNLQNTEPLLEFEFQKGTYEVENFEIACPLRIVSKYQGAVTSPEEETVDIELGLYNLPLKTLEDNYRRKIDDEKRKIKNLNDKIGGLKDFLFWSEKICMGFTSYQDIRRGLYVVTTVLGINANILKAGLVTAPAAPPVEGAATSTCVSKMGFKLLGRKLDNVAGKFCGYVMSCEFPFTDKDGKSWNDKVADFYHELPGMRGFASGSIKMPDGTTQNDFSAWLEPKRSFTMSSITGCLPGMILNLDEYRQIGCTHISCLEYAYSTKMDPAVFCDQPAATMKCKYISGQIFAIVPWTILANYLQRWVSEVMKNPFALGGFAFEMGCASACPIPDGKASFIGCEGYKFVKELAQVANSIGRIPGIIDSLTNPTVRKKEQDACADIDFEGIDADDQTASEDEEAEAAASDDGGPQSLR